MPLIDQTATGRVRMPSLNFRRSSWHFARHYLAMVVAMLIGMAVLGLCTSSPGRP